MVVVRELKFFIFDIIFFIIVDNNLKQKLNSAQIAISL